MHPCPTFTTIAYSCNEAVLNLIIGHGSPLSRLCCINHDGCSSVEAVVLYAFWARWVFLSLSGIPMAVIRLSAAARVRTSVSCVAGLRELRAAPVMALKRQIPVSTKLRRL
jgi:hypothetical protein